MSTALNFIREVCRTINHEPGKTDFWNQRKNFQKGLMDKCISNLHSLSPTEEINNLKPNQGSPISYIYKPLKFLFISLLMAPEANSRRAICLLYKFKCFHPFLERMLLRNDYYTLFSYHVTQYLCYFFPDTYAKIKLPFVVLKETETLPSFTHFLAHTTKRKNLLDAFICPLPNSRYYVGTPVVNKEEKKENIYHVKRDLKNFVILIRTGFDQYVENSMYVLKPTPKLAVLHNVILPMLIPYLWFHLSKPTEYFSTLCVQYSFPNVEETKVIVILDRINTALIKFHQWVVDAIHILDEQCRIVPDLIVEILKNIHLSPTQLFTHSQDSKYLHSLVVSECKSSVDRSSTIKGFAKEAPLSMRKCRKRKR